MFPDSWADPEVYELVSWDLPASKPVPIPQPPLASRSYHARRHELPPAD
jgi:hypothetical protein